METENPLQSFSPLFNARSVAVVGASGDPSKFGYMTLDSIIRGGYEGQIFPINPRGGELFGLRIFKSISEIPEPPELAVIIVPAKFVPDVLREAAEKGTKGAVILSAGFREAGRLDLEEEIVSIARQHNLRFVGPNVQGINYLPNKLCAMFFPVITKKGPLTVITQSGSVTAALSEWAADEGLGICAAVNLGNQADLCESDYIDFFLADLNTKSLALYIEGISNGLRFRETIRKAGFKKPITILKGGRSHAGQKAASSHTGALAGSYEVFRGVCLQNGIIPAQNLEHLYDCAKCLGIMRAPNGNRVLSISTSGGMGTLAVDEAEAQGLLMPPLPPKFIEELKSMGITPFANMENPLDMGVITSEDFKKISLLAEKHDVADIILLNLGDPVPGISEVAQSLVERSEISFAVSYTGGGEEEKIGRVRMLEMEIPVFRTPDRAMKGIGAVVWWNEYRKKRKKNPTTALGAARGDWEGAARFVPEPEAIALISQYSIPYPEHGFARNTDEAFEIAERIGYPVVMKVVSHQLPHKSDMGGVILGLKNKDDVKKAFSRLTERVEANRDTITMEGILVCKEARPGLEVIVGVTEDKVFGPTIMFGLGGIFAETMKDTSFRVVPLAPEDAEEMVHEIRGSTVLEAARGRSVYDTKSLIDLILTVSRLVVDHPEIKELDLNPVRLFNRGLEVLDVRLFLENGVD